MYRFRKGYYKTLERVSNLIELLISCHPQGFGVLLGEVEAPDSYMIHDMMNSQRVPMPDDFKPATPSNETEAERIVYDREYFDESVKMAGGWAHINMVSKEFKKVDSLTWSVVVDHTKFVKKSLSRYGSKLEHVAWKYKLSANTVMRYRREFSLKLAEMILMPPSDDGFYLLPS